MGSDCALSVENLNLYANLASLLNRMPVSWIQNGVYGVPARREEQYHEHVS
jgi:hypothetical protein